MQSENMLQIVYRSDRAPGLAIGDLDGLGEASKDRNEMLFLTGFLFAFGKMFVGVLEGTRVDVLTRMEEISNDQIHRRLFILRECPVAERRFRGWSFANVTRNPNSEDMSDEGDDFAWTLSRELSVM